MKCFFALRLQEKIRNRLEQLCLRMQEWDLPARWAYPYDLHVTLAYVGDIAEDEIGGLLYGVDTLLASQQSPCLSIPGLGAFSGKRWPRVLYAAVADPDHFCADLHEQLLDACDITAEHRYAPHMTLCRPQGRGPERSWDELLQAFIHFADADLAVEDLVLYESRSEQRPRYQALKTWHFIDV